MRQTAAAAEAAAKAALKQAEERVQALGQLQRAVRRVVQLPGTGHEAWLLQTIRAFLEPPPPAGDGACSEEWWRGLCSLAARVLRVIVSTEDCRTRQSRPPGWRCRACCAVHRRRRPA